VQKKNSKSPADGFEERAQITRGKFELLKLREEITAFIKGDQFKGLSKADRDRLEDLLVKVIDRQEKYTTRDAWGAILNR
jgi:hypothetical protein